MALEHDHDQDRVWQGVPAALRERTQWVVWRNVPRGGALTKLLYNPCTDAPAKANDLRTWATSAEQSGYAGIGYVFCAEDPYTGVDLDGYRNATTGAVAAWAQAIIDRLDNYTEVSPAGMASPPRGTPPWCCVIAPRRRSVHSQAIEEPPW